jgi:hypothetical protein
MISRAPTQRQLAKLITRIPKGLARERRDGLHQEVAAEFQTSLDELTTLTQTVRDLLAAGKKPAAERALKDAAARWTQREQFEPAVAAFEWGAKKLKPPNEAGFAEQLLRIFELHSPKAKLNQLLVASLKRHATGGALDFDRIRIELMKMRSADIRGRGEPFEGPTGSTPKTEAASLDALEAGPFQARRGKPRH